MATPPPPRQSEAVSEFDETIGQTPQQLTPQERECWNGIARYQLLLALAVLLHGLLLVAEYFVPPFISPVVALGIFAQSIVLAVLSSVLAFRMYSPAIAALVTLVIAAVLCFGTLTTFFMGPVRVRLCIPGWIIIVFLVNHATLKLRKRGFYTGLFGAKFPDDAPQS